MINRNLTAITSDIHHETAAQIGDRFAQFINTWHSFREPYDDDLDAWLHESYAKAKRVNKMKGMRWDIPSFAPSSAGASDRELYERAVKSKKDPAEQTPPHQRRWTSQGTAIGDWLQRDLLLSERHFEKFTGVAPDFVVERTTDGYPAFEDFVFTQAIGDHDGQAFSLVGTTDGILRHTTPDGDEIRVGLEIKTKQTTNAKTNSRGMQGPEDKHVRQCVVYSIMYGIDYFVLAYVNLSKKSWNMTPEDVAAYPDFRTFGIYITEEMREAELSRFARIVALAKAKDAPAVDLDNWTFNSYKHAIVRKLTLDDVNALELQAQAMRKSRLPEYKKRSVLEAYDEIAELYEKIHGESGAAE